MSWITRRMRWIVAPAVLTCLVGTAEAPRVQLLSHSELLAKSDVVIIGTPVATRDTEEETTIPGMVRQEPDGERDQIAALGIETTIRVSVCLKGQVDSTSTVILHHLQQTPMKGPVVGGPDLITFDLATRRNYLMFLVREADGRFAPTGGQAHPSLNAILELAGDHR